MLSPEEKAMCAGIHKVGRFCGWGLLGILAMLILKLFSGSGASEEEENENALNDEAEFED